MTRTAGLRGLLPARDSGLPLLHTLATDGRPRVPVSCDQTHGFAAWQMLGNGPDPTLTINHGRPVGDCFFAAACHTLMVKALVEVENRWVLNPELAQVIQPTANRWVGLYLGYQQGLTPGQTATTGPDRGTVLVDGLKWLAAAGIIAEYGPVGLTREQLDAGVFAHKALILGVALDEDADMEFEEHQAWRNEALSSDPIVGGHAIVRAAYTPRDATELTWGADQKAENAWEHAHVQEAYWVRAPWETSPAGYDLAPLRDALAVG